jgi:hypothetical protein
MKKILLAILLCAVMTGAAWAWDNRGHATIARIAERHLTPRAKANIEKYLDGQSFVYYASWMDFNRHKPPFDITRDWHVGYWTDDMRTDAEGNPLPPVSIEQTKRIIAEMADFRSLSDSLVTLNIKFLAHLVGDIHCPVHVDFPTHRPMKIKYKNKEYKYHRFWDGFVVGLVRVGYSPLSLAEELDRADDARRAELQAGDPDSWHAENSAFCEKMYKAVPEDKVLTDAYMEEANNVAGYLFAVAGYRMAKVFNDIFDK